MSHTDSTTARTTPAIDVLKAKVRTQTTETILECVVHLADAATVEERMIRAALIDVYIERTSADEGDKLMDLIGL